MPNPRSRLLLVAIVVLAVACANRTAQMTRLPSKDGSRNGDVHSTVVLFRVVADSGGDAMRATLSTVPRWKWHFLVNVGPMQQSLATGRTFAPGQLDPVARNAGWGFVTLPPGTHQMAFAAYRTRFAMQGGQRAPLGFGQSGSALLDLPPDAAIVYVGTFAFTCHPADRWWGYVERECTRVEIRDEQALALEVVSGGLSRFGPMHTQLASMASADQPH